MGCCRSCSRSRNKHKQLNQLIEDDHEKYMIDRYKEYVQQFNKEPTIDQFKLFANIKYCESKHFLLSSNYILNKKENIDNEYDEKSAMLQHSKNSLLQLEKIAESQINDIKTAPYNFTQHKYKCDVINIMKELTNANIFEMNENFAENMLNNNTTNMVTLLSDALCYLTEFFNDNNKHLLAELKTAVECLTYQPPDSNAVVWINLHKCIVSLCNISREFINIRDDFLLILMNIMWKPKELTIYSESASTLRNIVKDENDIFTEKDTDCCDYIIDYKDAFTSLIEIKKLLSGSTIFQIASNNLPKPEEYHKNKNIKSKDYLDTLQLIRSKTEIWNDDKKILKFLQKLDELTPLTLQIASRLISFKTLIKTFSELLLRNIESADSCPSIEWYFTQNQFKSFKRFIKPLNKINIYSIIDLKNQYNDVSVKSTLIPFLQKETNTKILMGEKRKLKRLCRS